jgi:diguanylate cyclase
MAWFKKESKVLLPEVVGPADHDSPGLTRVVDTLGALLREFGRGGLDLEPLRRSLLIEQCEQWVQHLLVGAVHPRAADKRESLPLEKRDWQGVRKFLAEARGEEARAVHQALGAMHQSLWAALKALDSVVAGGGLADSQINNGLQRLQKVARDGNPEKIRDEVLEVVGQIEQIHREKSRRQDLSFQVLRTQVHSLGAELEVARQESSLDTPTRLFNKRAFDERVGQMLAMGRLFDEPSTLLRIGIDHFREISAGLGSGAGDEVLRSVADAISRAFVSKGDFVARYHIDEFAVLLWGTGMPRAKSAAERLVEGVRKRTFDYQGRQLDVRLSVGAAVLGPTETPEEWVARASEALEQARQQGGDRALLA